MEWLLFKLIFDAGLRLSELTNLRLCEINDRQLNYIGKGRRQRESYISPETRKRLDDYIDKNNITDYLWRNPYSKTGKPYSTGTIYTKIKRVLQYAGFPDGYPHAIRHSFATDGQMNGANILELQEMLGHSKSDITQVYLHGLTGQRKKIFDQYKFGIVPKDEPQPHRQTSKIDEGAVNFMRKLAEEFAAIA
jgi:site-specific recombinase XerD